MDGGSWVLIPLAGIIVPMAMVVIVVWAIAQSKQRQAAMRAEVQAKMIEKFGSAPEFTEFLSSPAGREFVNNFQGPTRSAAHSRIFAGITWSAILIFVGIAFLVARATGEDHELIIPGGICFGLGVALMISTYISYRLSKSWGLIKPADDSANPGLGA